MKRDPHIIGLIGTAAIAVAIIFNVSTLPLFTASDIDSRAVRWLIWSFDVAALTSGMILLAKRKTIRPRSLAFFAICVGVTLVILEAALQVSAAVSPAADLILSQKLPVTADDRLGHRPISAHPEHDENGYRNAAVPDTVDIVTLGDSQTYGDNADRESAWPQQLQAITDIEVYNLAYGGYTPAHNLLQIEEALELKPRMVLATLYTGNDLEEAYWFVNLQRKAADLLSKDGRHLDELARLELEKPTSYRSLDLGETGYRPKLAGLLKALLRMVILATESEDDYWDLRKRQAVRADDVVVDIENRATILTVNRRLEALDISDPRIEEGLRICLRALRVMHDRSTRAQAAFGVLLIPTKELVYRNFVLSDPAIVPGSAYRQLVENEERVLRIATIELETQGIRVISALPYLREALAIGDAPYSKSDNGHPNRNGYRAIASAVADSIDRGIFKDGAR
ncbi:MAG: SGNH/GDSL hydrolase family protein [Gammaproteobacteria bacterium]